MDRKACMQSICQAGRCLVLNQCLKEYDYQATKASSEIIILFVLRVYFTGKNPSFLPLQFYEGTNDPPRNFLNCWSLDLSGTKHLCFLSVVVSIFLRLRGPLPLFAEAADAALFVLVNTCRFSLRAALRESI